MHHLFHKDRRVLYLNTNCIRLLNYHSAFLEYSPAEITNIFRFAVNLFKIDLEYGNPADNSLGMHLRLGDFSSKFLDSTYFSDIQMPPNSTPPLQFFLKALEAASQTCYSRLVLYTDASKSQLHYLINKIQPAIPKGTRLIVFPRFSNVQQLLQSMVSCSSLIHQLRLYLPLLQFIQCPCF